MKTFSSVYCNPFDFSFLFIYQEKKLCFAKQIFIASHGMLPLFLSVSLSLSLSLSTCMKIVQLLFVFGGFNLVYCKQTFFPMMLRSLARLVIPLVEEPVASVSSILYYSRLLPRNLNLERLVRSEFLHPENYLFHFLINILTCFW